MTGSGEVFEERKIYLDKPCKVGRSVAKLRPEPNNAIFDCKVLSRNHALLWEENSKVSLETRYFSLNIDMIILFQFFLLLLLF